MSNFAIKSQILVNLNIPVLVSSRYCDCTNNRSRLQSWPTCGFLDLALPRHCMISFWYTKIWIQQDDFRRAALLATMRPTMIMIPKNNVYSLSCIPSEHDF